MTRRRVTRKITVRGSWPEAITVSATVIEAACKVLETLSRPDVQALLHRILHVFGLGFRAATASLQQDRQLSEADRVLELYRRLSLILAGLNEVRKPQVLQNIHAVAALDAQIQGEAIQAFREGLLATIVRGNDIVGLVQVTFERYVLEAALQSPN